MLLSINGFAKIVVLLGFFLLLSACGKGDKDEVTFNFGPPGEISGSVKDAITAEGISGVNVAISHPNRASVAEGVSDINGLYVIEVPSADGFTVNFSSEGYKLVSYANIEVEAEITNYLEAVLQIDESVVGVGTIGGVISDAFSGDTLLNVDLNLRPGINVRSGAVVASTNTGFFGSYQFADIETGNYTIEASRDEYNTVYFSVISIGGEERLTQNTSLSKGLAIGEIRIVLTWGDVPSDLDSHLFGTDEDTQDEFHIYFGSKGSDVLEPFVRLDTDDTSSFGPETITITQQSGEIYRYYVNNFSGFPSMSDFSNAKVEVYKKAGKVATFNVPAGRSGDWWHVFDIENESITSINDFSSPTSSTLFKGALQKPVY